MDNKTMDNKKDLGQFFTKPLLAEFMVGLVTNGCKIFAANEGITVEGTENKTDRNGKFEFLDPAVGLGAFTDIISKYSNIAITACEIDEEIVKEFQKTREYEINLIQKDYLSIYFDKKFDFIVCNPPYIRFQDIKNRNELMQNFEKNYGISVLGYSNLCIYFLIKSMNELKENGRCCYIIPYEFMNTGYGTKVKEYLLKSRMVKSIYKFDNGLQLFNKAITTSCILLLENCYHESLEFIQISDIKEIESNAKNIEFAKNQPSHFENVKRIPYSQLNAEEKWINYFSVDNLEFIHPKQKYANLVKLSTFADVKRGIASGSNDYFALNEEMIANYKLSKAVCVPCIIKSRDVKDIVITKKTFDTIRKKNKKVFLFDGCNAKKKSDIEYIAYGESLGINKLYLTSHRNPWYSLENKGPAPIWISVFNRQGIKVIRNELNIRNLTSFHGLYFARDKACNEEFINLFYCYLLTPFAQELLYASRREYGNGLDKFEPKDLSNAYMIDLNIISKEDKIRIGEIYLKIRAKQKPVGIQEMDGIFRKYI